MRHPANRAKELVALGVEMLCVHCAFDLASTGASPLAELQEVRPAITCRLAVAGGLNAVTVGRAIAGGADIGGRRAILNHKDPRATAKMIIAELSREKS